jgi:UDP-GlcNAc3NAcA epimerase
MKIIPELADVLIWTGQHYSTGLVDAYDDQLKKCGEVVNLGERDLERMAEHIQLYLIVERQRRSEGVLVTVYGDTDSTLAGAVAAQNAGCDLAHVEAGLRCGNMTLPEERNRIVVDALSDYRFSVSGYGDIMQERLFEMWQTEMGRQRPINDNDKWICTVHRAENSDTDTFMRIVKNIALYVNRPRIFLHPKADHLFWECEHDRLAKLQPAISYKQMLKELWNCAGVITDSGGLMREAAWLGKPCIVLRDECEFPELVEAGRIKLVGRSEEALRRALAATDWKTKVELQNPNTTQKILDHLGIERRYFGPQSVEIAGDKEEEREVACLRC